MRILSFILVYCLLSASSNYASTLRRIKRDDILLPSAQLKAAQNSTKLAQDFVQLKSAAEAVSAKKQATDQSSILVAKAQVNANSISPANGNGKIEANQCKAQPASLKTDNKDALTVRKTRQVDMDDHFNEIDSSGFNAGPGGPGLVLIDERGRNALRDDRRKQIHQQLKPNDDANAYNEQTGNNNEYTMNNNNGKVRYSNGNNGNDYVANNNDNFKMNGNNRNDNQNKVKDSNVGSSKLNQNHQGPSSLVGESVKNDDNQLKQEQQNEAEPEKNDAIVEPEDYDQNNPPKKNMNDAMEPKILTTKQRKQMTHSNFDFAPIEKIMKLADMLMSSMDGIPVKGPHAITVESPMSNAYNAPADSDGNMAIDYVYNPVELTRNTGEEHGARNVHAFGPMFSENGGQQEPLGVIENVLQELFNGEGGDYGEESETGCPMHAVDPKKREEVKVIHVNSPKRANIGLRGGVDRIRGSNVRGNAAMRRGYDEMRGECQLHANEKYHPRGANKNDLIQVCTCHFFKKKNK